MKKLFFYLLLFSLVLPVAAQSHPVALFYMTDTPASVRSFLAHSSKIGILVPTWYSVDANGLVTGGPNPLVLETAKKQHLPVMPILGNSGRSALHSLLANDKAQSVMIASLLHACKQYGYAGIQIDFEDIAWTDRDALSAIVKKTADALHAQGLKLTIAVIPNAPGSVGKSDFSAWMYAHWRGVYDLKALAQSTDLICLMTYDQHTQWTPPGPVAGWNWTVENLDYALKVVPKEKLSLGIPLYGYHWFSGMTKGPDSKPHVTSASISAPDAELLAREYNVTPQWDSHDRDSWFYFDRDHAREWVFYTDAHAFEDRYKLAQERGIQGFCAWVLGVEDPAIWDLLPDRN